VSRFLLDTDTVSLITQFHPVVVQNVLLHLSHDLLTSIITIEEIQSGWFTALRRAKSDSQLAYVYERYTETANSLHLWPVETFGVSAISRFRSLQKLHLPIGGNDLRIAAIALESAAIVVTRNLSDFRRIPGIVAVDWAS